MIAKLQELLDKLEAMPNDEFLALWDSCKVSDDIAASYANLERYLCE